MCCHPTSSSATAEQSREISAHVGAGCKNGHSVRREWPFFVGGVSPKRLLLSLLNEVEIDLEANGIGDAQQDRHTWLLHLDVVKSKSGGCRALDLTVLELSRSLPGGRPRHAADGEVSRHFDRAGSGRRERKRNPARFCRNERDHRIVVGLEQASTYKPVATILVAHECRRVHGKLRRFANHLPIGVERDCAGQTLCLTDCIIREVMSHEPLADPVAGGVPRRCQYQPKGCALCCRQRRVLADDSCVDP